MVDPHEGSGKGFFSFGELGVHRGFHGTIGLQCECLRGLWRGPGRPGGGEEGAQSAVGGKDQSIGIHGDKFSPVVV